MDNCYKVKQITSNISFSDSACWIDSNDTQKGEWYWIKINIDCSTYARLLISSADGAKVYANGSLIYRFVTRSYIYNKAYDVIDIFPTLNVGANEITILTRSTGEIKRRGIIFEIDTDLNKYISGSCDVKAYRYPVLKPGVNFMIMNGSNVENVDLTNPNIGEEISIVSTSKIYDKPFEKMLRTTSDIQTSYAINPQPVTKCENWSCEDGYGLSLSGLNEGSAVGVYRTTIKASSDNLMFFQIFSGVNSIYVDGQEIEFSKNIDISEGIHTLDILGTTPRLFIKTKSILDDFRVQSLDVKPLPRRRYPWNDLKAAIVYPKFDSISLLPIESLPYASCGQLSHYDTLKTYKVTTSNNVIINDNDVVIKKSDIGTCITYDFVTEVVGYLKVKVDSSNPISLDIHCFEISSDVDQIMGEKNHISITSCGSKEYVTNCRRGYRYVKVYCDNNDCDIKLSISTIASHCPVDYPTFECDNTRLEQIYKMCLDTAKVCTLDYYVDCPGHEQNPWVGDARITAKVNLNCFGKYNLDAAFLRLIADSMSDKLTEYYRTSNPRYVSRRFLPCATFPTYPDGNIAVWSYQWILSVYDYYMSTGDIVLVKEVMPQIIETLKRSKDWYSPRGLLNIEGTWNLVDWANNDLSEYGEVSVNNMMLKGCFDKVSYLMRVIGDEYLAKEYEKDSKELKENINKYCFDKTADAYVDTVRDHTSYEYYLSRNRDPEKRSDNLSEEEFALLSRISVQTATFAILYDIADGHRLDRCCQILKDNVDLGNYVAGTPANRTISKPSKDETPDGIVKIGSPFFMYFALDALYKIGEYELCEKAILRDFGDMLDKGIHNCTEVFNAKDKITTRSICHGWSTSPAIYITEQTLGVKIIEPGYKKFTIKPSSTLNHAKGSIKTPYGDITVEWTNINGNFDIKCDYPKTLTYIK